MEITSFAARFDDVAALKAVTGYRTPNLPPNASADSLHSTLWRCNLFRVWRYSCMQGQDARPRENDPRMQSVTDEELMLQVRDGAGETLGVLFERYHAPIYNFYTKLTGDRALSEDLVQEVFLRILRHRQTFRDGTPFRAWIYQIARNARIDHFRKTRPQVPFEPEMAPTVSPGDPAQQRQESELLHKALMGLPEEKRELLVLCRFQELPYEDVARLGGWGGPA